MKKIIFTIGVMVALTIARPERSQAQVPIVGLFTSALKKIITAIDLKVQRLQNQTIALQNAEQQLENNMSLGRLNDISGWLNKEKNLYQGYYQELAQVKTIIADYDVVKRIISQQKQLLSEYQSANALFHRDKHFSAGEISYMGNIYAGILQESLRNLDEVLLAVNSFITQMDDAGRLQRIHQASSGMQANLDHLRQFNQQNVMLSLARVRDEQDRLAVKQLYGITP
ncbi:conjugal transfer protein TraI [Mucilaginibacter sp.]|uniref:conjugal transfer protein TraI n=1 Tax=Mucilaginibacter sp. TaxID=1882438 RepID=UPI00262A7387|nr:conjugal transfer protein TraI [Mucilaginibacter sp.]MDB4921843.1 conjugal transfer protein TraI [Mucilaginibacter sp.]